MFLSFCLLFVAAAALNHTDLQICPLITKYGYPCEEYQVLTSDGWYLKIQRIPPYKQPRAVVFFQHGLLDSAAGILLNGDVESLPFILADNGYDIWLGNNRGNKVSMQNIYYTSDEPEFWDFSMDEMGSIDLQTQINFVLNYTQSKTLSYIGHSEGTSQAFMGFENKTLAAQVDIYIAMAPITYVNNTNSTLLRFLADIDADKIAQRLGIMAFEFSDAFQYYLEEECANDTDVCYEGLEVLFGPSTHINESALPADTEYFPAATSMKNMAHWLQWVRSGRFEKYDYGTEGNIQHYGQSTPPQYNSQNISLDFQMAFLTGTNDYLADPVDVDRLLADLNQQAGRKPIIVYTVDGYAHADFVLAYDAYKLLYPTVLDLLAQYSRGS